jgi:predicted O-methyltransferase YrrM
MKEYFELISSEDFKSNLNDLNSKIIQKLDESDLLKDCEEKRIRVFQAAKRSKSMFEIGVNGGHSSFLCLKSNKDLTIVGNDIAEFYPECPRCHPEIYVPEAFDFLESKFNNRFVSLKGNCLTVIPEYIKSNPNKKFDLVHIDGAKETYKQDFLNLIPSLEDKCLIIFDDSNMSFVQKIVNDLVQQNYLRRIDDFPQMDSNIKYRNEILEFISDSERKKLIFENIYKNNIWIFDNVRSGHGSGLNQTTNVRFFLNKFISNNSINSVTDLGCGDLNWIKYTKAFSVDYTGIDISETLINEHKNKYPGKKFYNKDIIKDEIPQSDLIIIRDVLFHTKIEDINLLFENIRNKFKYILVTSCNNPFNENNHNNIYHFSKVNVEISPFNKIKGEIVADESHSDRKMLLFTHENFY